MSIKGADMSQVSRGLLAALTVIGFASIAAAADMPVNAPVYKAPPPPISTWTGVYFGAQVGYGWTSSETYTFADPGNAAYFSCGPCINPYNPETLTSNHASSLLGGVHFGFDQQVAPNWLIGFVADMSWTNMSQSAASTLSETVPVIAAVPGSSLTFSSDLKWLFSMRVRTGLIAANNWLFYVSGGPAWAGVNNAANATCPPPAIAGGCVFAGDSYAAPFAASTTTPGFVFGGGLEWQVPSSAWRARLEYLYYGFEGTSGTGPAINLGAAGGALPCIVTPTCSENYGFGRFNVQTVRLGLSYSFH
jgi:outer membrane immunogenic protein